MENIENIITIALAVIGLFATIAAITPNKSDDKVAQFLLDLVNLLGANVGKAKNGTDKENR